MTEPPLRLSLTNVARLALVVCITVTVGLVIVDLLFAYLGVIDIDVVKTMASLDREEGIGTWFASTMTLFVALALGAVALTTAGRERLGWTLVAVLFVYLAFDDGVELHERVSSAVGIAVNRSEGGPPIFLELTWTLVPSYVWHGLFGPPLAIAGAMLARFLHRHLRSSSARRWAGVGLITLLAATGLDIVEGLELVSGANRHFMMVYEESLEMLGMAALLHAFLRELAGRCDGRLLAFDRAPATHDGLHLHQM